MRIDRIDLIQYGCFDGTTIELPSAKADIHILYGPNEAGKSTGLNALGDLLFGIPSRTPFGFRHELQSLRIGALLDGDPGPLEIARRKGTKNTLLGPDVVSAPVCQLESKTRQRSKGHHIGEIETGLSPAIRSEVSTSPGSS